MHLINLIIMLEAYDHFISSGLAYTTGLSHNPFNVIPALDKREKMILPKRSAIKSYVK